MPEEQSMWAVTNLKKLQLYVSDQITGRQSPLKPKVHFWRTKFEYYAYTLNIHIVFYHCTSLVTVIKSLAKRLGFGPIDRFPW